MPTFQLTVPEPCSVRRGVTTNLVVTGTASDKLGRTTTVTGIDIMAQSVRSIDVLLEMDRGEGIFRQVTRSELGGTITLHGSLEGFGVRELEFQILGGRSPMVAADLRGSRRVRMIGVRGIAGGSRRTTMFDGYLRSATFDTLSRTWRVTAQEASPLNKMLEYTLPARSYRTRDDIIREICRLYGIRVGSLTWTGVAAGGGNVFHEINEAGDRPVLAFLAEFVVPTGHRIYQEIDPRLSNGHATLNLKKFHPADASVRTLTHSDIHGDPNVTPPEANAPNVVRFSSPLYPYVGPDLTGTIGPTTTAGVGASTGLRATFKQDKTTGVVSAIAPAATATIAPTVITTLTYDGGSLLTSVVEEWGWYTPEIARRIQNGAGVMSHRTDVDCYQYADGLWYVDQTQTCRMKKRTTTQYGYITAGWLSGKLVTIEQYTERETYFAHHNNGTGAELPTAGVYRKDDGTALEALQTPVASVGFVPEVYNEIYYPWATNGAGSEIASVRRLAYATVTVGGVMRNPVLDETATATPPMAPGMNVYVYGPTASKRYARYQGNSFWFYADMMDYYATVTDDSHTVTTQETASGQGYHPTGNMDNATADLVALINAGGAIAAGTVMVGTPRPQGTQLTDSQSPQTQAVDMPDNVRLALNHGHEIVVASESPWCETVAEIETAAIEKLREIGAFVVTLNTDVDWEIGEGDVITLPEHQDLGPGAQKALILSSAWNVDFESFANSQQLRCVVYPQELT